MIDALLQDVRFALRTMRRKPGFAAIVVLALAIGIGANTAIFSVVNAVLLQSLPYKEPDKLVMVWETNPTLQVGFDLLPASSANFADWRDQNKSFESVSIIDNARVTLTGTGAPERVAGANVSSSFFDVMGVAPVLGRVFSSEEDKPGNNRVAVISYAMWQRRFGGGQDAIGKSLVLDGESYFIIGIMPEGFQFPRAQDLPSYFQLAPQTELWLPIGLTNEQIQNRESHNKAVIARLKPEVTIQQARADLTTIAARLADQYPDNLGWGVAIVSLQDQLVGDMRTALWVLLGAVGFVLLIACANVANLLLAKSGARQKEIAIRIALGGSRRRVVRQLLTENLLLSLTGGLAGILLAVWGINLFLAWSPANIPRKHEIGIDASVLGFTFAISLLTGLIFGLAPAIQTSKPDLNEALKDGLRGSTSGMSN
ncbi:MAG TPA: ABC transporter permease, partial [Blastocatellia bacterium]